ncbi:MAG TPA: hypothetical protein VGM31_17195, partial [Puia sp.]
MPLIKLSPGLDLNNKSNVADLHNALALLKLAPAAPAPGQSPADPVKKALQVFKMENDLGASEDLTPATIDSLNLALHDKFIASSKSRVKDLQTMLEK